ncbi:MAG: hypothetical protein FWC47_02175 [Oscillospiraceae bacterium]|nr:hypothetical protein [Oscillospiraceae bacterium]
MNYNKYIINKRKKQNYLLLIIPLIILFILYFVINSFSKGLPIKIARIFSKANSVNINSTSLSNENVTKSESLSNSTTGAAPVSSNVASVVSYYLIGFYEENVDSTSEKIIESVPSIKIKYNNKVFFLMKIMLQDEYNNYKTSIDNNKFSTIEVDFSDLSTNDKLMDSIFSSMKDIFTVLTGNNIKACKTERLKNWALSLPKEEEGEKYYDQIKNAREQIANLKDSMILEDCIGIIQTIIE